MRNSVAVGCFVSLALSSSCDAMSLPQGRIVGGERATERVPWMISMYDPNFEVGDQHYCGGFMINEEWFVTAAHCVVPYGESIIGFTVSAGMMSREDEDQLFISQIKHVVCHPDFSTRDYSDDICLVQLEEPASITEFAVLNADDSAPEVDSDVWYLGWGVEGEDENDIPNDIRTVSVYVVSDEECMSVHSEASETNICTYAEDKDACAADSGGPVISKTESDTLTDGVVVGIVSWGRGCANVDMPGVNTRVSKYIEWINSIIPESSYRRSDSSSLLMDSSTETYLSTEESTETGTEESTETESYTGIPCGADMRSDGVDTSAVTETDSECTDEVYETSVATETGSASTDEAYETSVDNESTM
eukprot:CFRG5725T1